MNKEALLELLEKAIGNKNAEEIEEVTTFTFSILNFEDFEKPFLELLSCDWHYSHEDITRLLQQFGSINSVDGLFKVATKKFEYLDYNDSKAFARKCTWALADIGNIEAKEALIKLSQNEDQEIAEYAKQRIDNWYEERNRKRHSS